MENGPRKNLLITHSWVERIPMPITLLDVVKEFVSETSIDLVNFDLLHKHLALNILPDTEDTYTIRFTVIDKINDTLQNFEKLSEAVEAFENLHTTRSIK